jgi:PAS domain S-box-containing protein
MTGERKYRNSPEQRKPDAGPGNLYMERMERLNRILRAIRNVNQLIVQEEDRQRLIQGACDCLTENLSYRIAWVALLDDNGRRVEETAYSGIEKKDFQPLQNDLDREAFPTCMSNALKQPGLVVTNDGEKPHPQCAMGDVRESHCGFSCRLESNGRVYGVLAVYVPATFADDPEERELFEEVAGDLGFSLGKIEMAKQQKESEAKFRSYVEHSPYGVFVADGEGRYMDVNPAASRITGYSTEELTSKSIPDFLTDDTREQGMAHFKHLKETGASTGEVAFVRADGTIGQWKVSAVKLDEDRFLGFAEDVTETRRLEQDYQTLFREMLDGFAVHEIICDDDGHPVDYRFLDVNPAFERMTGLAAENIIGKTVLEALPETETHWIETYGKVALSGEPAHFEEFSTALDKHFEVTAFRNAPNQFACMFIDITARKQAEKEREDLLHQLSHSQKLESVGRLAGGVAHDFNNLLMGIINYCDMCRDEIDEDHPIREWLDEISTEAERSASLTRQLLAFARKQIITPRVVDLSDTVSNMLKMIHRLIGEDIDLSWHPASQPAMVQMDPAQIDQILANLCVNARDAISGVGYLTIETQNVSITEDYCADHLEANPGCYAMLSVSDDGSGMEKETLEHAFEPFYTTKKTGEGTGLGLATVYGIVKQNNGFINVYSEVGKGTTFRIYLPFCEENTTPDSPMHRARKQEGGNETILLVEDEKSIRVTTAAFLGDLGYNVLVADNPETALELVKNHADEIHLLITDVVMPGMSGRELAQTLQSDFPDLEVLYMSGYTANVIAHHGILEDNVNFLSKPFGRDHLAQTVREILDLRSGIKPPA